MKLELAYLLGLITGRGHFFPNSKNIAIEFSHTNEIISGIAHCSECGYLVTNTPGTATYKCKNTDCGRILNEEEVERNVYNQPQSTKESLSNNIVPYLENRITAEYQIIGNNSMTLLVLDFKNNPEEYEAISAYFGDNLSFDKFHIPKELNSEDEEIKIEYINGLLDTAGFNNSGGWLNRDGNHNHGRMRSYFQIVRNWYLPVEIDNFIRDHFELPLQTIDWGHPNIRDSSLKDYYNSSYTSWSREHQLKFFPEYYKKFSFKINHKQRMYEELINHNEQADFGDKKEDWFPNKRQIYPNPESLI